MSKRSMLAAIALWASTALADAPPMAEPTRGELLYSTHCGACHTTQIHWRDKKLATDWSTLQAQVRRWQNVLGLQWSDGDVDEVARFLNALHYHYPLPGSRSTESNLEE